MTLPHLIVVDDDTGFRDSLRWLLQQGGHTVSTFETASSCLDDLRRRPDLTRDAYFLLDIRMPDMDGFQLLEALASLGIERPIIFLTGHGDVPLAIEAMRLGAISMLEKPLRPGALEDALATAAEQARHHGASGAFLARCDRLTPREREVMALVVIGKPNKVIAYELGISPKTVELHRSRIMSKMEAGSLTELVRMAVARNVDGIVTRTE